MGQAPAEEEPGLDLERLAILCDVIAAWLAMTGDEERAALVQLLAVILRLAAFWGERGSKL